MMFPLVGNEKVRDALCGALRAGKLPHAVLITGEEGQGKRTLADYLAKAIVCENQNRPCGECRNCSVANAGAHPDIVYVRRNTDKKEILIKQIQNVRADAIIKPHMASGRVFIIEEAERMNIYTQNAFLKILEEPPIGVTFILLASSRDALLPTVLSRTVAFNLSSPTLEQGLSVLLDGKKDKETVIAALNKTHGNIGAAAALMRAKKKESASAVAEEFTERILNGDYYGMMTLLSPYEKNRVFMDKFIDELTVSISSKIRTLNKNGKRAKILYGLYERCGEYKKALKSNVNLSLLCCNLTADIIEQMR